MSRNVWCQCPGYLGSLSLKSGSDSLKVWIFSTWTPLRVLGASGSLYMTHTLSPFDHIKLLLYKFQLMRYCTIQYGGPISNSKDPPYPRKSISKDILKRYPSNLSYVQTGDIRLVFTWIFMVWYNTIPYNMALMQVFQSSSVSSTRHGSCLTTQWWCQISSRKNRDDDRPDQWFCSIRVLTIINCKSISQYLIFVIQLNFIDCDLR